MVHGWLATAVAGACCGGGGGGSGSAHPLLPLRRGELGEGVVRKPGQTQGRRFFGCGRWTPTRGAVCNYHVWDEAAPLTRVT
uniref:Zinc finger GRF-type domain-containing protein n=1 Tax=Oryza punctata TaxID=4537 RepID=A0A0E0MFW7_ORYPU